MAKVPFREWIWVVAASALVLIITTAPYYYGYQNSTPENQFGGFVFGMEDMHSYLAKMRYGTYNGLIFRLVYTTEPHTGGLVFTFHLLLGKLTALLTGQGRYVTTEALTTTYHVARLTCGFLLLLVMYRFIAEYLETPPERRLAWGIAAIAGGLGWIVTVMGIAGTARADTLPVEFYVPEAFTLLLLYGLPHLSLARTLLLIGWLALFRAVDTNNPRDAVIAGMAWLGMSAIVPFYAALLGVLIGAWLLSLWVAHRKLPLQALKLSIIAGILPVIVLLYNTWVFASDPTFAAWSQQNTLPSPPITDYFLAYGLLLILAIPASIALLRSPQSHRTLLLLSWPAAAFAMVYLPINVQRRLLEGVIMPISILAALGVWRIVGTKPEEGSVVGWRLRQIGAGIFIFMLFPSTALLIGGGALTATSRDWPLFHEADELAGLNWLREHSEPGSIVMVTHDQGNILPAYAPVRVYLGHGPETIHAGPKIAAAESFFEGSMPPDEAQAWFDEVGARYVWVGIPDTPNDCPQNLCFDPADYGLHEVFNQGIFTIYEVGS